MNMWPGVRLRVTEGFDEDGHHPKNSLHYEGRAVAISTSDRDTSKYGMLARLAVDAGFDWVYYESRTHIYCSVKTESTVPSRFSGCFHGSSTVLTKLGTKLLSEVEVGEEILSSWDKHSLSFSKVIGFLHKDPYYTTNFIKLHTESNNSLILTRDHLLVQGATSVLAEELNVGDSVIVATSDEKVKKVSVNSITYVNLTGVYAPLTEAGTVFIDGVLCSCYAVIGNHDLAHLAFLPLRFIYIIEDKMPYFMQQAFHLGLEWIRSFTFRTNNTGSSLEESSQIHWYAQFLCEVAELFDIDCL